MAAATSKAIGLVVLLLLASKAQARTAPTGRTGLSTPPVGNGRQVPLERTGGDDFTTWARERLALAVIDLATFDPPVEPSKIDDVAIAIVAQWAHETAKGRAEFNYNLGGWTARSGDDFHAATDRLSGKAFRWTAYPDLPTAVEDQIKRLVLGFPKVWPTVAGSEFSRDLASVIAEI